MRNILAVEHEGKLYAMTPEILLQELTYRNYKFNRQTTPNITPEEWLSLFPTALEMEKRLRDERRRTDEIL